MEVRVSLALVVVKSELVTVCDQSDSQVLVKEHKPCTSSDVDFQPLDLLGQLIFAKILNLITFKKPMV